MEKMNKFNHIAKIYDKYRPTYPDKLISDTIKKCQSKENMVIADIGAGTGILTQKLIGTNRKVMAIEPNEDMREVLANKFKSMDNFEAIDGTAECTKIEDNCVDLVTVAQAFHWFAIEEFRKECKRILKPKGKIFIIWNKINMENEIVQQMKEIDYQYSHQYKEVNSVLEKEEMDNKIKEFFQEKNYEKVIVSNDIKYSKEAFIGYNLSKSYSLRETDIKYSEYVKAFEGLFEKYQENGILTISNYVYSYLGEL